MPDPDHTQADIDRAIKRADELSEQLDDILANEAEDPAAIAFSIWLFLTHYLFDFGWTTKDLIVEVLDHFELHQKRDEPHH